MQPNLPSFSTPRTPLTLSSARCGGRLRVLGVVPTSTASLRLEELGFCEAQEIFKMTDGNPLICRMRDMRLAIRATAKISFRKECGGPGRRAALRAKGSRKLQPLCPRLARQPVALASFTGNFFWRMLYAETWSRCVGGGGVSMNTAISLSALAAGQKARIAGFDLPPETRDRLFEMGLTMGAAVELVRFAPLGDPMEVKVRGYHLSLRKREAAGVQVVPE